MHFKKRGFALAPEEIVKWILALLVLAAFVVLAIILKNKDMAALDFFKNILKFRR